MGMRCPVTTLWGCRLQHGRAGAHGVRQAQDRRAEPVRAQRGVVLEEASTVAALEPVKEAARRQRT